MLTIVDGRSGRRTEALTAHGGVLRLHQHLSLPGGVVTAEDMRVLVVGDVLLRAVEMSGGQVTLLCSVPADSPVPDDLAPFWRAVRGLGVHLPADVITDRGFTGTSGGTPTVHVDREGPSDDGPGIWLRVGPVEPLPGRTRSAADAGWSTADPGWSTADAGLSTADPGSSTADPGWFTDGPGWFTDGRDALGARLVLMTRPHASPVALSPGEVAAADRELGRWRARMARWASRPSHPVPPDTRRQADQAVADDLGTPAVLELMRDVEKATDIPDGTKFETFALLDRFLGLELASEIGHDGTPAAAG